MEPTTKKSSKLVIWIIVIIVIILAIWFATRNKAGTPEYTNTVSETSVVQKSELEASAADAVNFDDEASLKQMDQEFQ